MTLFIKSIILSSLLFFVAIKDCKRLTDGIYKVKYFYAFDSTFVKSKIEIRNDSFSEFLANGDSLKGKIEWMSDCYFKLNSNVKPDTINATELSKLLTRSFGESCFEIKETKGDTTIFRMTHTENLHVTTCDGEMIKMR
jgi:uncharacterized protein (UPF0305 family)